MLNKIQHSRYPLSTAAWLYCYAGLSGTKPIGGSTGDQVPLQLFQKYIVNQYSEPQRHYHTMNHIEDMLSQWEAFVAFCRSNTSEEKRTCVSIKDQMGVVGCGTNDTTEHLFSAYPDELLLAEDTLEQSAPSIPRIIIYLSVLFHDVIYDPRSSTNEEDSIVFFMKFIEHLKANPEDGAPEKSNVLLNHPAALEYVCTEVSAYISATISHLSLAPLQLLGLPSECQPVVDGEHSLLLQRLSDCLPPYTQPYDLKHVFLDLDLSILGSKKFGNDHTAGNNSSYVDCYADLIAKEYIPVVGEKTFREKRAEFLEGFLAKPQWFKTPYFYFQMEETARENVRAERKYLQMTASSHTD